MQNDALVAQMEGMSYEEQQQFLAQQVTEQVSLVCYYPLSPLSHTNIRLLSCCTLVAVHSTQTSSKPSCQSDTLRKIIGGFQACHSLPKYASTRDVLVQANQTRHDMHLTTCSLYVFCYQLSYWLHGMCAVGAVLSLVFIGPQLNQLPTEEREAAIEGLLGNHHPCGEHCGHDHEHDQSHDHSKKHEHGPGCSHALQQTHTAEAAGDLTKATPE